MRIDQIDKYGVSSSNVYRLVSYNWPCSYQYREMKINWYIYSHHFLELPTPNACECQNNHYLLTLVVQGGYWKGKETEEN